MVTTQAGSASRSSGGGAPLPPKGKHSFWKRGKSTADPTEGHSDSFNARPGMGEASLRSSAGGRGSEGGGSRGSSAGGGAPPVRKSINPFVNFNMDLRASLGEKRLSSRAEPTPPTGRAGARAPRADPHGHRGLSDETKLEPVGTLGDFFEEHIGDDDAPEVPRMPGVLRLTPQPPSSFNRAASAEDEDRISAGINAPRRLAPTPGKRNQILPMIS